jgi:hypothetical protein
MANVAVQPLGPLFGPDFLLITVADPNSGNFELEVFPDANNATLKANGLPMQFYYMPKTLYLAKKQDNSGDFDFSVTLFKGLMTTEDTLGVGGMPTSGGEADAGGAFVSFSTTMAVPDSVVASALEMLKSQQHGPPPARIANQFARDATDPAPLLGVVPITDNQVTIEVPQLPGAGDDKSPWFISAQGKGQGSIEASGISSFLVTCNELAAGAIVGALKAGMSPFTVHYNLTEMFYMNACQIQMDIDVDKVFTQFSGAVQAKYGFFAADLQANYQSCITSGGITTVINENEVAVDADLKKMIDTQVGDMQTKAWDLVKNEIFNWQPKPDAPASASAGACGGVAVALKFDYQKHGVHFNQSWTLNDTVTKLDMVSGTLTEIEPAIKANLNKYLAIVDIGQFFQKLQVAATANVDFSTQDTADPIDSISIEVSYPNLDTSGNAQINGDGTAALQTLNNGFHYTPTAINTTAPSTLARWTKDNPNDIINISFMRMAASAANWDQDQVSIKTKLEYHTDDPRVDLSGGTTEFVNVVTSKDHTPVVGPANVGYIYVLFTLDRRIAPNETVTLEISLGSRTDTLTVTSTNPLQHPQALWQVWSDKYFNEAVAKVKITVEVAPPPSDFTSSPVTWSGNQAVAVGLGRIKRIVPCTLQLPPLTDPDQAALAAKYVLETQKEALAGAAV